MREPSGPQKVLLCLGEGNILDVQDIIAYYRFQGYTSPEKSAYKNMKKLVDKELVKRTRYKGLYKITYNNK